MDKKKYKQQNNNNLCWILDDKIRDVLPLFIIKLELNDIKNLRLVCRKFQSLIDNHCDKLFNLIFRLRIARITKHQITKQQQLKKQQLKKIIKFYPIITSFFFNGFFDDRDLITYIPNYTKELKLDHYNQLNIYEFPSLLESLSIQDSILSLKSWNSISFYLSSLELFGVSLGDNENIEEFPLNIEEFPLNLKKLSIMNMNLMKLKIWPQNLVYLKLSRITISFDQILNLSKLSTLSYLKLEYIINITEIDLSNFNSLKSLTYCPFRIEHIYFPSSLHTLILCECSNVNVESTKLPKSLIRLEIFDSYPDLNLFLLKKENKFPFLKIFINGKPQK